MTELKYKTKGGALPTGKPRVYFTCHPADLGRSLERLSGDLTAAADCAVYYTPDMSDRLPEETRETDLERMNLFVIPISLKLLLEPNRAMEEDFPFALEKHIPVLPILLEPGLDPIYSRADKFGSLQYLDPEVSDPTAIPYAGKLKRHLTNVLVDAGTAERVRNAFDARIFLSYRKKDRRKANDLMRLIHADRDCRDIAVWFDEYLTPGESFSAAIQEAMKESRSFALLVTPSLLERNDRGEPNYVQATEFPAARDAGIPLLPAELPEPEQPLTDREALGLSFPGLPSPLNLEDREERERFLDALRSLSAEHGDDPEHDYLMGLAYLEGIEVETDRDRGLQLLTAAGEAEQPEAMKKLTYLYNNRQDYRQALTWSERHLAYCLRACGEGHRETLNALESAANQYAILGEWDRAIANGERKYALQCQVLGETHVETLETMNVLSTYYTNTEDFQRALELAEKSCAFIRRERGDEHVNAITSMANLSAAYLKAGMYRQARDILEEAGTKALRVLGDQSPVYHSILGQLSTVYTKMGEYPKALDLAEQAYALSRESQGQDNAVTLIVLGNIALLLSEMGQVERSLELQQELYPQVCRVLGETHPKSMTTLANMGASYHRLRQHRQGIEILEKAYAQQRGALGEDSPDLLPTLTNLGTACESLGEYAKAQEYTEKAYALSIKVLGEEHPDTLEALRNLATVCIHTDKRKALAHLEEVYPHFCKIHGKTHPKTLVALNNLGVCCCETGSLKRGVALLEKAYAAQKQVLGLTHPDTMKTMYSLSNAYWYCGQRQKAMKLTNRYEEVRKAMFRQAKQYTDLKRFH